MDTESQAPACKTCSHQQRPEIERDILDPKTSLRAVERKWGIGRAALSRHKRNHMDQELVSSALRFQQGPDGSIVTSHYAKLALSHNGRQQCRFVDELMVDPTMNPTQAAIRAGYAEKTAAAQSHRLMQLPSVRNALLERLAERAARVEVREDQVIEELRALAHSNVGDLYSWDRDGERLELKASKDIPAAAKKAIKSIRKKPGGLVEVTLHDKMAPLKMLGAHAGLTTDRSTERVLVVVRDPKTGEEVEAPIGLPALPGDVDRIDRGARARPVRELPPHGEWVQDEEEAEGEAEESSSG